MRKTNRQVGNDLRLLLCHVGALRLTACTLRDHNWSVTPLGPIEGWSERLKLAVELMLSNALVPTLPAPRSGSACASKLRGSETRQRLLSGSWAQAVWETDARSVVVADSSGRNRERDPRQELVRTEAPRPPRRWQRAANPQSRFHALLSGLTA